jgi:SAM-dependent methyltransferase
VYVSRVTGNSQGDVWNGESGRAWVEHVDYFDHMLGPFGDAVLDRLGLRPGDRVVDVGCGVGATTLSIASIVAPETAVGVDISSTMLEAARARASAARCSNVEFRYRDVQDEPIGVAAFDAAFSRFGVMFFPEPDRAFTHIRQSLVGGGRFGFVCFQGPFDNPMILQPVIAAAAHVEMLPPPGPTEPSPFSLADPDRVRSLLSGAGFVDIVVEPGPSSADLGSADDLEGAARRAIEQNPGIAPGFAAAPHANQAAAVDAAVNAMSQHIVDGRVVMGAATWVVTARVR